MFIGSLGIADGLFNCSYATIDYDLHSSERPMEKKLFPWGEGVVIKGKDEPKPTTSLKESFERIKLNRNSHSQSLELVGILIAYICFCC